MKTQSEIKAHLNRYSTVYANSRGFKFGSGAKYSIKTMADNSAKEILNPPPDYLNVPTNSLIGIAEKSIAILIDHMIISREKAYDDFTNSNIIGEQTLEWARRVICPMWPIC